MGGGVLKTVKFFYSECKEILHFLIFLIWLMC